MFLTEEEILNLSHEDFVKYWNDNSIQDSCLKQLGRREMNDEEKKRVEEANK